METKKVSRCKSVGVEEKYRVYTKNAGDRHFKEMGMDQASAREMVKWRPLEYRRKVDTAMRCFDTCPQT